MLKDKFEMIGESVEIGNIDETIDMLLDTLVEVNANR